MTAKIKPPLPRAPAGKPKKVLSKKSSATAVKKIDKAKPKPKRKDKRGAPKVTDRKRPLKGHRGNPPYEVRPEDRIRVEAWVAVGAKQELIAEMLSISVDTLQRHFRAELDHGKDRALSKIGGSMVADALNGDKDSQKFVLARIGGWKAGLEHSGPNGGPIEYRDLSDEELDARIAALTSDGASAVKH